MMEKIANVLAKYIIRDTELEYDVIKYGIDAILSTVLCFSTALFVCALIGNVMFGVLFIVFLTPIKMQFLGYHCKTMFQCITTYSICSGTLLLFNNYLLDNAIMIHIFVFIIVMLCIIYLVRSEINKKNSLILGIYIILGTVFYFNNYALFINVFLAIVFELILLILRHITH